jgi:hypothetical protein
MIDLPHSFGVLSNRIPWQEIEELDLFGATEVIAGAGISKAGCPRLPNPAATRGRPAAQAQQFSVKLWAGSIQIFNESSLKTCAVSSQLLCSV